MRFASVNIHQHTHATSVMLIVCIIQAQLPGLSLANGLLTLTGFLLAGFFLCFVVKKLFFHPFKFTLFCGNTYYCYQNAWQRYEFGFKMMQ